jgi:hypothetical protein
VASGAGVASSLRMRAAATRPPIAHSAAAMSTAWWKPVESRLASAYAAGVIPARPGSTATASRPAVRAMSLLTADATPT